MSIRGNALFLILIAVALFAALSYAITQSGRGGNTADKERAVLDAARATQAMGAIQSAIQRMVLTGTDVSSLQFCSAAAGNCNISGDADDFCSSGAGCIFAPEGGGVSPPTDLPYLSVTFNTTGTVENIGTTAADPTVIFLSIGQDICENITREYTGSSSVPACSGGNCFVFPTGGGALETATCPGCVGVPFQCYNIGAGYHYYHVMLEK